MPALRAFGSLWLLTSLVALGGCGLNGPAHDTPSGDAAAVVEMGFMSFDPETAHIRAGQTVQWRNTALITHSVTTDKYIASDPNDAAVPAGAEAFNSGDIAAGEVYSHTFTVPGTYKYFCTHHEGESMVGTVIVDPAS